jgi:hypothetical protein
MEERRRHYSNKGGHFKRGTINRILNQAFKKGLPLCKGGIINFSNKFDKKGPTAKT